MALREVSPLDEITQRRPTGPRITASQADRGDASRLAPLVSSRSQQPATSRENRPSGNEDERRYLSINRLRTQYLDFLGTKANEIEEQKESRHYYHGAQWTPTQIKILRARFQPPNTNNKIARKINGIAGLIERMRSDPKAQPNTPKHEEGAEIATQSIRYVLSRNDWKSRDPFCLLQCGIDGIAGVELKLVEGDHGDPDVAISEVLGDEYFYDPRSYRYDFSDKRYDGIAKWLDVEAAIELFPDKEDVLYGLIESGSDLTTNSDREYKWISTSEKRVRLVEHWYKHRGEWCWAFYVSNVLLDEGVSPFKDEKGETMSRFVMFSAHVDHDGDRYGFVRNLKGLQDAVNQRGSKALHISNSRRLIMEKGAVDNVETARREWARPDGVVEVNPGLKVEPDNTQADLAAQFQFLEEAKNEIDNYGNVNIAAQSGVSLPDLSGRAIELLRQPAMAELGPFILAYRGWKLRVYRAIWNIIQQYWTAERWIRVTDDEGIAQFIQLNGLSLDQYGRPAIVNAVGALDVDIDLEEGPDVASAMADTYDALKGYPPGTFPPQVLIELAPIRRSDKQRILQMLAPQQQPPDPAAEMAKKLQLDQIAATNADLQADALKKQAEARKTHAQVDQVEADAAQKRSAVVVNAARAGHLATTAHLDAADFGLRALREAREASAPRDDGEGSPSPAGSQAHPQPVPIPQPVPVPMPAAPPQAFPRPF